MKNMRDVLFLALVPSGRPVRTMATLATQNMAMGEHNRTQRADEREDLSLSVGKDREASTAAGAGKGERGRV